MRKEGDVRRGVKDLLVRKNSTTKEARGVKEKRKKPQRRREKGTSEGEEVFPRLWAHRSSTGG